MLKLFNLQWLAVVMLLTVAALPVRTQASTPSIIISEIAWAGSSSSASDEWIELTNVGDTAIDLTGWTLTGAGSSGAILTLPEGSLIEPQSTYLISNYEYTHANTALAQAPQFATSTLSLSNSGFSLSVFDATGAFVDGAGGDGAPFAGRSGGIGDSVDGRYTSMVRVDGLGDGTLEESWADADTSHGFIEGVEDFGTPGVVAFASATTEPETKEVTLEEEPTEKIVEEETIEEEAVVDVVVEEVAQAVIDIQINEFVVDPLEDGVEWIELYNNGDTLTLDGWTIEDAAGKSTDLSGLTIEASSYLVIEEPNGKLNNDGDTIILKDATGSIVESVTYGSDAYPIPQDGESLARNGDLFEITQTTTPGSANVIVVEQVDEVEEVEKTVEVEVVEEEEAIETVEEVTAETVEESLTETTETAEVEETAIEETQEEAVPLKTLQFISLYPNTSGSDEGEEYIEIQNTGIQDIDLQGWTIRDGSTDTYVVDETLILAAGTTMRLMRTQTKITLNNGGDTLELEAPDGDVVDLMTYGNAAKGETYDLVNGEWKWSGAVASVVEAIPTTSSTIESVVPSTASSTSTSTTTNQTAIYTSSTTNARVAQSLTVEQAKGKADGVQVSIKGVVTAVPGVFGSQVFYLEDETGGIQIYMYSGNFPDLVVGDVIKITGEMSTSRGERRVKLSGAADVVPASGSLEVATENISLEQIDESLVGSLVATQGIVQSKSSTKLVIEDFGATLTIYLKGNPAIDPNQFERGDTLSVTGVLTIYDGELRLRPRSLDDIHVIETAVVTTATIGESTSGGSSAGLVVLFSTMAALAGLAAWHYLPRRRLTPAAA